MVAIVCTRRVSVAIACCLRCIGRGQTLSNEQHSMTELCACANDIDPQKKSQLEGYNKIERSSFTTITQGPADTT